MSTISKKIISLISIAGVLALFGFGCKGLTVEQKQATASVALEYWTVYDDVDAINGLIAKYKQLRPYLKVTVRQFRADELYQKLIEALADDRGPDIISVSNRELRQYYTKLAPMPGSVKDTTVQVIQSKLGSETKVNIGTVTLPSVDQIDREYVPAVKKDAVIGGRIYGLPLSFDTMAIYYNKDLLDRAGLPEPPKNWDDFQSAVKKITRYDREADKINQAGAALGTGNNVVGADDIIYLLFNQSSIPFTADSGQASLGGKDSSGAFTVMNFFTDFANSQRDTYTWNEKMGSSLDQFVNGSLAFFFGYSYHLPIIRGRAPQLNFSVMPMIQLSSDEADFKNVANYSLQTVTAKSRHPGEAWALINYMTHSSANGDYLSATKRPTALRSYISQQKDDNDLKPFVGQLLVAKNWYHGRNYSAAVKALADLFHEWLNPPANLNQDRADKWRSDLLNRTGSRINQTL